jgi:hypothetical protein
MDGRPRPHISALAARAIRQSWPIRGRCDGNSQALLPSSAASGGLSRTDEVWPRNDRVGPLRKSPHLHGHSPVSVKATIFDARSLLLSRHRRAQTQLRKATTAASSSGAVACLAPRRCEVARVDTSSPVPGSGTVPRPTVRANCRSGVVRHCGSGRSSSTGSQGCNAAL